MFFDPPTWLLWIRQAFSGGVVQTRAGTRLRSKIQSLWIQLPTFWRSLWGLIYGVKYLSEVVFASMGNEIQETSVIGLACCPFIVNSWENQFVHRQLIKIQVHQIPCHPHLTRSEGDAKPARGRGPHWHSWRVRWTSGCWHHAVILHVYSCRLFNVPSILIVHISPHVAVALEAYEILQV